MNMGKVRALSGAKVGRVAIRIGVKLRRLLWAEVGGVKIRSGL